MAIRFSQSVEEHWAQVYKLGGTQPLETKVAGRTEIYSTRRAWNNLHTASCIDTGSTKLHRTRNVHLDSYIGWTGALIIQSGLPWTVYYSSIYKYAQWTFELFESELSDYGCDGDLNFIKYFQVIS